MARNDMAWHGMWHVANTTTQQHNTWSQTKERKKERKKDRKKEPKQIQSKDMKEKTRKYGRIANKNAL
jgi:hypothetical protein